MIKFDHVEGFSRPPTNVWQVTSADSMCTWVCWAIFIDLSQEACKVPCVCVGENALSQRHCWCVADASESVLPFCSLSGLSTSSSEMWICPVAHKHVRLWASLQAAAAFHEGWVVAFLVLWLPCSVLIELPVKLHHLIGLHSGLLSPAGYAFPFNCALLDCALIRLESPHHSL